MSVNQERAKIHEKLADLRVHGEWFEAIYNIVSSPSTTLATMNYLKDRQRELILAFQSPEAELLAGVLVCAGV